LSRLQEIVKVHHCTDNSDRWGFKAGGFDLVHNRGESTD
jgi:hypothetical protein